MGRVRRIRDTLAVSVVGLVACGGCAGHKRARPQPIQNAFGPVTIAVAPAINQSGSSEFDANRFADVMAAELGAAPNVRVTPVSRVLAVLSTEGHDAVMSPEHAGRVARALGADAMLIFAVTHFDAYDPPRIGLTAQLYGRAAQQDAVSPAEDVGDTKPGEPEPLLLLASTQRILDAADDAVVADLREYAASRGADGSPFGWRRYVVSQQYFMRYCCNAVLRDLLVQGPAPLKGRAVRGEVVSSEGTP